MRINIIGSGNVATHLAKGLKSRGHTIVYIASRNLEHANELAQRVEAKPTTDISNLSTADVTIISVSDNSIKDVANELSCANFKQTVLHTSGATPLSVLSDFESHGVLYPCMTFSKEDTIDLSKCPFLTEASTQKAKEIISEIIKSLGARQTECDSEKRSHLHVAAVFASNFTNHMLTLAKQIMDKEMLPFDILEPLVTQTISKGFRGQPHEAQTGPARRRDTSTIERHCEYLRDNERLLKVYQTLTKSIEDTYEI